MGQDKKPFIFKLVLVILVGVWVAAAVFGFYDLTRKFWQPKKPAQIASAQQSPQQSGTTPTSTTTTATKPKATAKPQPKTTVTKPKATTPVRPAYSPTPVKIETVKPAPKSTPKTGTSTTAVWNYGPQYSGDNWSGYVALNKTFTAASGEWIVPNPSTSSPNGSGDSAWVGVGGWTNAEESIIQTGSDDDINNGQVDREAWYELYPADTVYIPSITIHAGDTMYGSVSMISTGYWNITIKDVTDNESYSKDVNYSSLYQSAEWIEEDVAGDHNNLETIDNFGSVKFEDGKTTANGVSEVIGATVPSPVTMTSDATGNLEESPTKLNGTGNGFTVNEVN